MNAMSDIPLDNLRLCLRDTYPMSCILYSLVSKPDNLNHAEQLQVVSLSLDALRENADTATRIVMQQYPELKG